MTTTSIEHDQAQRKLALNIHESFIVQAPAGSGKTELLIQRFLALLGHVKSPDEILAITFTKKAANEMRVRVITALQQASLNQTPVNEHQKTTYILAKKALAQDSKYSWHLLQNPNQLRIQTIDSLCAYLTTQLPLLSRFGAQPQIADNPGALYRTAVSEVLTHVEGDYEWAQSIAELLLHLDNDLNKLHDLLTNLLAKRDQWLSYLHFDHDDDLVRHELETHLQNVITDTLIKLKNNIPTDIIHSWLSVARFCADNLKPESKNSNLLSCQDIQNLPQSSYLDIQKWRGLASLLLTKSLSWRKRFDSECGFPALSSIKNPQEKKLHEYYRKELAEIITVLSEHQNIYEFLTELFVLPNAFYDDQQWHIMKCLLHVLKIVASQLHIVFQQHGKIDFIENMQAALIALGNNEAPTDLALALDYQIRHILVDEFQDTSFSQYQLIEKLTLGWESNDGRTLFIVGDPMQSIYRFREAEVGLFIRLARHGLQSLKLTPLQLSVNFRSQPKIVAWNNAAFTQLFPRFEDIATGAVCYNASITLPCEKDLTNIGINGFENANEKIQAESIIQTIQDLLQDQDAKITVLVRSRTHLQHIIPLLKQTKLDYQAVDIDALDKRVCIQDLFALTSALLHLGDRISWLAILRAPWCGLSLADLHVIASRDTFSPIWKRLQTNLQAEISADGWQRLQRIIPILKSTLANRQRSDLRTWIENTWILLGGPATLDNANDMQDVKSYFELLSQIQNEETPTFENIKDKIASLYANNSNSHARIQLMTIHTAKGLEFDHVILPHLEKKLPFDDKTLLSWMERPVFNNQSALLLAPINATGDENDVIYHYIRKQQRVKANYEIDRLLYVAATRAKKSLHLFFNLERNSQDEYQTESGSFLQKLWPYLKNDNALVIYKINAESESASTLKPKQLKRLVSTWNNPITQTDAQNAYLHKQNAGFHLPIQTAQIVGTVIHLILCKISNMNCNWWQSQSQSTQTQYIYKQLQVHKILKADMDAALSLITKSINNTLHDEKGLWILQQRKHSQSEYAITVANSDTTKNLIIDRCFIEKGVRWIIDYKTTTFSNSDLQGFLESEQHKYLDKMLQYAQALNAVENLPTKLGLYFPSLPAWQEWEAPSAIIN